MAIVRRTIIVTVALSALGGAVGASTLSSDSVPGTLHGRVTTQAAPVVATSVYAYQLADLTLDKVLTAEDGTFRFGSLPAGLYKIIAFKSGFVPAVVMLSRATAEAKQFLDLELNRLALDSNPVETGFWSIREKIPTDVLRDIQFAATEEAFASRRLAEAHLKAEMQATTGVREGLEYGNANVTSGELGIDGRINDLRIALTGNFSALESQNRSEVYTSGSTQLVSLNLQSSGHSRVNLSSLSNRLSPAAGSDDVDFESHQASWTQRVGRTGRADLFAQYTSQNNFHNQGTLTPREIPLTSQALRLEGSYTTAINSRATIQAGFRYRDMAADHAGSAAFTLLPRETMELFGRGGVTVSPAFVVEYGLTTTLRDGSLSVAPQGGLVFNLGSNWRASTLASRRIHDRESLELYDFLPVFHDERGSCDLGEEACYQVLLSRLSNDGESFSIGAVHREYGDTLRLYFNRDFYDRLESLFMVRGDRIPELQLEWTHRIGRAILTRLESNLAAGGGGIVRATNRAAFENKVRYLVTSLDTQFESSSTGVFLAFHRLEQELTPMSRGARRMARRYEPEMALERLQVMLTQDLGILGVVASDLSVHVNMELSRGYTPETSLDDDDEIRKRLTGGISLKF